MEIYTAVQAQANLSQIIDNAAIQHKPVCIVSNNHRVILISEEDYELKNEMEYIQSISGLEESIIKARQEPKSSRKTLAEIGW